MAIDQGTGTRTAELQAERERWVSASVATQPIFVDHAHGARITDVDGHTYVDLCLGDTGSMPGHGPAPVVAAVAEQAAKGITTMLPTENAAWVGEEMARGYASSSVGPDDILIRLRPDRWFSVGYAKPT